MVQYGHEELQTSLGFSVEMVSIISWPKWL